MRNLIFVCGFILPVLIGAQTNVYLIPGQGADQRLFNHLTLDSNFEVHHIQYFTPEKGTSLAEYARQLSAQIDTTQPFVLIGTSLGGMLACEMTDFLTPQKVIVISSAKSRDELPFRYKFMRVIPLYKLVPPRFVKGGARIMQPLVEPDRKKEKETFKSMLKAKNPHFMKRTVAMIINWDRDSIPPNITHIHGTKDHTLPIRKVNPTHVVDDGSHMMTLTKGEELSLLLMEILRVL